MLEASEPLGRLCASPSVRMRRLCRQTGSLPCPTGCRAVKLCAEQAVTAASPQPTSLRQIQTSQVQRKRLITDLLTAFEKRGSPVRGARILSNGDVVLLAEGVAPIVPQDQDAGEWVSLAGEA